MGQGVVATDGSQPSDARVHVQHPIEEHKIQILESLDGEIRAQKIRTQSFEQPV